VFQPLHQEWILALLQTKLGVTETRPLDYSKPVSRVVQVFELLLVLGLCAVLGFGPLALGAVQPWAICVLEVISSLLVLLWFLRELATGRFHILPNPLYLPMVLFAIIVIIQLLFHLTAYWYVTWSKAMLWTAYAGLLFSVSQTLTKKIWLQTFGLFCSGYGFLLSLFAIIQQFTWNGKIYWIIPNRHGGWVYGPYVNHAHYAGLMEMLVPFPLILGITEGLRRPLRAFLLFAAIVMSSTIFLSQSVGGMIAFASELSVLVLVLFQDKRPYREIALLGVICSVLIGWLIWLRPMGLMERLARLLNPISDAGTTGRVAIIKDSLKMVVQRPVLGWGLGTFSVVYPSFRSFYSIFWVNEAHNDLVQMLVECGILGFILMFIFLFLLCSNGFRNGRHWRDDSKSSMILAAVIGCVGMMVHSLFDFNLQIPANAAFFFTLAALAVTDSYKRKPEAQTP